LLITASQVKVAPYGRDVDDPPVGRRRSWLEEEH
jgi:hypothetical protein